MLRLLPLLLLLCTLSASAQVVPAPQTTVALVCAYNTAPTTLPSGSFGYLQCDNAGHPLLLSSIGTPGDVVIVGPGTQQIQDAAAQASPALVPNGLQFSNSLAYSGAYSINQQWLTVNGSSLTGTVGAGSADGLVGPLHVYVGNDTADTTTTGPGNLNVLAVNHATAGGSTGGRTMIFGSENIVGTPTTLSAAGYVGVGGQIRISANMGGATGAYTNYKGDTFGGNSNAFTTTGATFIRLVNAHEFDTTLGSGSSAAEKHGITVVLGANDAVRATYDDSAIEFGAQDNASAVGWKTGIMFGAYAHQWPFATDSTLIGVQTRQTGTASTSVAKYGVDVSGLTITTGGAGFRAPLITPSSSSAACDTGAIVWDTGFIYICTATNTWKRAALSTF